MIAKKQGQILNIFFMLSFLFLSTINLSGQKEMDVGWELLADVTFSEKYDEATQAYWLIPKFGKKLKSYNNKEIELEGYFLPIDLDSGFFVLSKFPYSSCFFCGAAGPESIVELQMDKKMATQLKMDQRVRFRGTLTLNKSDFNHCNYILKSVVVTNNQANK